MVLDPHLFRPSLTNMRSLSPALLALGMGLSAATSIAAPITSTPQNFTFAINTNAIEWINADTSDQPSFKTYSANATSLFNAFDSSLGTLQQVVFKWQSHLTASVDFGPVDDPELHASLAPTVDAEVVGLGTLFNKPFSKVGATGEMSLGVSEAVNGTRTYSAPADLAYFIGTGTFSTKLNLSVKVGADNGTADMVADWGTQTNTGLLSLEYVYEARPTSTGQLPEPGMALLVGSLAAIAAGVAGRRREQSPR